MLPLNGKPSQSVKLNVDDVTPVYSNEIQLHGDSVVVVVVDVVVVVVVGQVNILKNSQPRESIIFIIIGVAPSYIPLNVYSKYGDNDVPPDIRSQYVKVVSHTYTS